MKTLSGLVLLDERFRLLSDGASLRRLQSVVQLADCGFLGGNTFVVHDLHVIGFLNEDFWRAFWRTLSERAKRVAANHDLGRAGDVDCRADGPLPIKDTRSGAEAGKRVAFHEDLRAIVRDVFRRIAHDGFGAGNSRKW